MQKMLVRVIEFLTAFSALATGEAKDLECKKCLKDLRSCARKSLRRRFSHAAASLEVFNELGRESVLFQLLQVPSEEVQDAKGKWRTLKIEFIFTRSEPGDRDGLPAICSTGRVG